MTFNEYPFKVPNLKTIEAKFIKLLEELKNSTDANEALKSIKKWNKYSQDLETQFSIIYVLYSLNTNDNKYKKAQQKCDEISPYVSKFKNDFAKLITSSKFRKELETKLGTYLFEMYDDSLKAFSEIIMPEMIEENKLVSKYDEIMGGAEIEFDGKVLNTSQLGKYLQDEDDETREKAAKAFDKWLGENEKDIADIYSQLVTLRNTMALKLGFKDFTELGYLRLGRTDYNPKMVEGYRKQIGECFVPLCNKLYKAQAKMLGIKNPQYYDYSLRFKDGNAKPAGNLEYLVKAADKMYSSLSEESRDYFRFMQDNHLMDLDARSGKAPGGYCTFFPKYKAPFIFSNFNGTEGDVNVLTHEGGHAFQAYLCSSIKIPEYMNPTLESCEIHSMSMEFFAWPYMEEFCGKDAKKYKFAHLCDAIEFLPYGISVDEFQHWVYAHPNATHEERCRIWKEIETKYTPHKKYDKCPTLNKGTIWMRQSHIFANPFYYIDYTLAQVVAFQFLVEDRKDHVKAWKKYVKLCKCGGKYPFCELLKRNHLRNPFEDGNLQKVIPSLKRILKEVE